MPSIRKRIGYLPSPNIHEMITNISIKEKLSQSKVVGILVEEALIGRGLYDFKNSNKLNRKSNYRNEKSANKSSIKYSDLDELISDNGITYHKKRNSQKSDNFSSESRESYNEYLFEQLKKFILFQKMEE